MAKVGLIGFGGGNAMVTLVKHEVVDVRHWMTMEQFQEVLSLSYAVPGLSAGKLAAFIGWEQAGVLGMFAGLVGIWLPGMIFMMALFYFLRDFSNTWWYPKLFRGFLFAAAGLIAASIFSALPSGALTPSVPRYAIGILISVAVFVILTWKVGNIPPVVVVIAAGLLGLLLL
ncbi:chromate transporter [Candidatus Sumerlaeota bacterium]|nr:chromate transporter [Candidatus Sumerlaeota bacterium]